MFLKTSPFKAFLKLLWFKKSFYKIPQKTVKMHSQRKDSAPRQISLDSLRSSFNQSSLFD